MKLKKGDEIQVVIGKDKGKKGKIDKVFTKERMVLMQGLNQYKRHVKARSAAQPSEIVVFSKPLREANVQLVCPKCHLLTRVGYSVGDKKKVRICKKCEQTI